MRDVSSRGFATSGPLARLCTKTSIFPTASSTFFAVSDTVKPFPAAAEYRLLPAICVKLNPEQFSFQSPHSLLVDTKELHWGILLTIFLRAVLYILSCALMRLVDDLGLLQDLEAERRHSTCQQTASRHRLGLRTIHGPSPCVGLEDKKYRQGSAYLFRHILWLIEDSIHWKDVTELQKLAIREFSGLIKFASL